MGETESSKTTAAAARRACVPLWSDGSWKRLLVLLVAATGLLGAIAGALHVDSGARAAAAHRDARAYTLDAIGRNEAGVLRYIYERERLAEHQALLSEWYLARRKAEVNPADQNAASRLWEEMEAARSLSRLLSPPYFDETSFAVDVLRFSVDYLVVPQALVAEREAAWRGVGDAWERKSTRYVLVITTLAVALFLFGLALAARGRLRSLFASVGGAIGLFCLTAVSAAVLSPVPQFAEASLELYAGALGETSYAAALERASLHSEVPARTDRAIQALTHAIALRADYGAAYAARGNARLLKAQALLLSSHEAATTSTELPDAISDYRRAAALGQGTSSIQAALSWALFLSQRSAEAAEAAREAVRLAPTSRLRFGLRLAIVLLGAGQTEEGMKEAEIALAWAEAHPLASDPLTFRETIWILNKLRPILPLAGGDALEVRVKEAFVSLTYDRTATPAMTSTWIGPLVFSTAPEGAAAFQDGVIPVFPSGTERVTVTFEAQSIRAGALVVLKVLRDGDEEAALETVEPWTGPPSGPGSREIRAPVEGTLLGISQGEYAVDLYVDGRLLRTGAFAIR